MDNKLSVCIEMLFSDLPFLERIERTAALGFAGVEFWGWQDKDLAEIHQKITELDIELAAFAGSNTPLNDPTKTESAVLDIKKSIATGQKLDVRNIIITVGQALEDVPHTKQHDNIIEVLQKAAPTAEAAGITLVLEPLNTVVDHQGYYLASSYEGYEILEAVNSSRVKMLFDIYHQQITEGNIIENITEHIELIGHFHLADVPGRQEPGTGELNYANILSAVDKTDYDGFVGCEFRPSGSSEKALDYVQELNKGRIK